MKLQQAAYTLIELLTVLSITAILIGMAPPAFQSLVNKHKQDARTEHFYTSIQYARLLAIEEGHIISLCTSIDGIVCNKAASNYLIVFHDENNNKKVDNDELKQKVNIQALDSLISIKVSAGRHYIRFRPDGTAIDFGRIKICPLSQNNNYADELVLNYGGRLRQGQDADNDGIVEGKNGKNIQC
ncbi:GspH/FimT family pseudopilin [Dasania sp. GY-MA-18]|uniref:Type II secretion system protein H n=1 Tax=Dasania phycosphaerae TaxID=2950436 RepID=A0A9J6RPS2_9GAMM|nr:MULTISPECIES: GspH/FimT family pseudopilin [Dasania]MCR8923595.1 GspH/FimT family pseudopilin [Dasania sp. GY-MA-18]MCZ0866029.1 GspH/FimT family pseudopilin [Dasania phycosphaerae]MCZ0869753.1 GspH/FimT family pseudopilin [Dasania phycosphaerae]